MKYLAPTPGTPSGPRTVRIWNLSTSVWQSFLDIAERLEDLPASCDEAHALRDDIRALPGHPRNTDEYDCIVPVLTTTTRHGTAKASLRSNLIH